MESTERQNDLRGPSMQIPRGSEIQNGWGRLIISAFLVGIFVLFSSADAEAADPYGLEKNVVDLGEPLNDAVVDVQRGRFYAQNVNLDEIVFTSNVDSPRPISGSIIETFTGVPIVGICVGVHPFGQPDVLVAEGLSSGISGNFSISVPSGTYQLSFVDCDGWDYVAEWYGGPDEILPVIVDEALSPLVVRLANRSMTGLVDTSQGLWALSVPRTDLVEGFFFGNPGDFPILGDWNCNGVDTPGMYRQSDGYVYLRNFNTQGIANIRFFFGNPGDIPLAGDFNGDGCDTVSIFRPSESRVFIINELGQNDGGLGAADLTYFLGNPGDKPFVGDFDGDGVDTIGLHRETTGLVYFRNSHTQGIADVEYIFGDPGDRLVAGNFSGFLEETPAVFRPSDLTFYIRHTNTQGNANRTETWGFTGPTWYPVAGVFGLTPG